METTIKVSGIEVGRLKTRQSSPIIFEVNGAIDFLDFVDNFGDDTKENIARIKQRVRGVLMLSFNPKKNKVEFYDNRFVNRNLKNVVEKQRLGGVEINESAISI